MRGRSENPASPPTRQPGRQRGGDAAHPPTMVEDTSLPAPLTSTKKTIKQGRWIKRGGQTVWVADAHETPIDNAAHQEVINRFSSGDTAQPGALLPSAAKDEADAKAAARLASSRANRRASPRPKGESAPELSASPPAEDPNPRRSSSDSLQTRPRGGRVVMRGGRASPPPVHVETEHDEHEEHEHPGTDLNEGQPQ